MKKTENQVIITDEVQSQIDNSNVVSQPLAQLPIKGLLRESQLLPFLPFSKSTLWNWASDGRFPAPIKLSKTVTCWRATDIHKWLASHGEV